MPRDQVGLKYTKTLNREVNGVKYWHLRITGTDLDELAEKLGWEHGTELEAEIRNGKLVVARKD